MKSAAILIVGFALGFILGKCSCPPGAERLSPELRVLTRVDTFRIVKPETVYVRQTGMVVENLRRADSEDSIQVEIPIQQAVYSDSAFTAYVSGYRPQLDSIFIYRPVSTVLAQPRVRPKRFALGLSAGYALTPAGAQPYVGVGISLKLWEF